MKKIITISREFGSGGRSIGKRVADKLGYKYYDKELIEKVAEKSGLSKKYVAEAGEYAPSKSRFSYAFLGRNVNGLSVEDYLWSIQRGIILDIGKEENCVIVGRCADHILGDREDCLSVFIHADPKIRAKRIVERYGETDTDPFKRLKDKDRRRSLNYKYYTDRQWGVCDNYDIALNSGTLGLERCVEIVVGLAR